MDSPRYPRAYLGLPAAIVIFIAVLSWAAACSALESARPGPAGSKAEKCIVGAYLTCLYDFDFTAQTFGADMWLWTHTSPESKRRPLQTMEFTNAGKLSASLFTDEVKDGVRWEQRKICGTFRQHWDLRNFPFDSHKLEIHIEEGVDDAAALTYQADARDSSCLRDMRLGGWKITDFQVISQPVVHSSTFGDPALQPGGASKYAGLIIRITVQRKEVMSYIKLTSVAYISFLLMLLSFFLHLDRTDGFSDSRMTLLAGALFATVINMSAASSTLGSWDAITLVDKVHIVTLLHILFGALLTVLARVLLSKGVSDRRLRRMDLWAAALATITFIGINGYMVIRATRGG
jgi:hypothetical protein